MAEMLVAGLSTFDFNNNFFLTVNDLTLHESVTFPTDKFEAMFKELAYHVKTIVPRIKRDKIVRNVKQVSVLEPEDAVELWLNTNNPKGRKKKFELAVKIIDEVMR